MKHAITRLEIPTQGKGLYDITPRVIGWARGLGIDTGLLTVFVQHTSASLVIQENADPDVVEDLETFFSRLVPDDPKLYRHTIEGPDDMPAHIRAALTATQLSIPISAGWPMLGTWQGIYLFEHRSSGHRRSLVLHASGEERADSVVGPA
ncbi:MAG: secondary thiamine-phosphate synthase enzyme YjbQ [Bryobacteraceae bacterium]